MSLSVGIVGFPNVGKSTLFQIITKKQVDRANYPFCTIDPNVGVVSVPDERIEEMAKIIPTKKKVYSAIEFIDIAGLVEGASQGKGLGNRFLSHIRETSVIVYVLRAFKDSQIISSRENIDPIKEGELLETELILKDLEVVNKRILSLEKEVRARRKEALMESETLKKAGNLLEKETPLIDGDFTEDEEKIIFSYRFLTHKPKLYLLNGREEDVSEEIENYFRGKNWEFLIMDIKKEEDSAELNESDIIDKLIKKAYDLLNSITFFTAGPDEIRAWKIKKGEKAPKAGGVIHSDFEKKFIKAIVVHWKDLIDSGGWNKAKKRMEGKDYVVKDGDVVEIKHSP